MWTIVVRLKSIKTLCVIVDNNSHSKVVSKAYYVTFRLDRSTYKVYTVMYIVEEVWCIQWAMIMYVSAGTVL